MSEQQPAQAENQAPPQAENQAPPQADPLSQGGGEPANDAPPKVEDSAPPKAEEQQSDPLAQQQANKKRESRFQQLSGENKQHKQEIEALKKKIADYEKAKQPRNHQPDDKGDDNSGDDQKKGQEETPQTPTYHPSIVDGLEAGIKQGAHSEDTIKAISEKVNTEIPELADASFVAAIVKHNRSSAWVDAAQNNPTFLRNLEAVTERHPGDDMASQKRRMNEFEYIISHAPEYNGGNNLIGNTPTPADPVQTQTDPLRTPPTQQNNLPQHGNWQPKANDPYDVITSQILQAKPELTLQEARMLAFRRQTKGRRL